MIQKLFHNFIWGEILKLENLPSSENELVVFLGLTSFSRLFILLKIIKKLYLVKIIYFKKVYIFCMILEIYFFYS